MGISYMTNSTLETFYVFPSILTGAFLILVYCYQLSNVARIVVELCGVKPMLAH